MSDSAHISEAESAAVNGTPRGGEWCGATWLINLLKMSDPCGFCELAVNDATMVSRRWQLARERVSRSRAKASAKWLWPCRPCESEAAIKATGLQMTPTTPVASSRTREIEPKPAHYQSRHRFSPASYLQRRTPVLPVHELTSASTSCAPLTARYEASCSLARYRSHTSQRLRRRLF